MSARPRPGGLRATAWSRAARSAALVCAAAAAVWASSNPASAARPVQDGGEQDALASDPVALEWSIRARALDLAAARPALDADLADARARAWPLRRAALDAIARALAAGGGDLDAGGDADGVLAWAAMRALAATSDPHPNVRAEALRVLAALPPRLRPSIDLALADDAFPPVRAGAALALEGRFEADVAAALARLARDPDERVATSARASLFALRPPAGAASPAARKAVVAAQLATLRDLEDDDAAWLDALRVYARGRQGTLGSAELPAALRAEPRSSEADPVRVRERRAVAAALELGAETGEPGETGETGDVSADDARVAAVLDGWLGQLEWNPRRQALLVAGARRGMGAVLLAALERAVAAEDGPGAIADLPPEPRLRAFDADLAARIADGREGELFHARYDLFEALCLADGANGVAARLADAPPTEATLAFALPELGLRVAAWDPDRDATWLLPERARDVRIAAAEAFAHTLSSRADPGAAALLVRALEDADPIVVRIAFRALCDLDPPEEAGAPSGADVLQALHRAWLRADADERLQQLAWLPRDRPLAPFRAALVDGASSGGATSSLAIELLGTFVGDADVAGVLTAELRDALGALAAAQAAEGVEEREVRAGQLRVLGLLRALDRVQAPIDPRLAQLALGDAERELGPEVGKVAAGLLARGPEPERLGAFLGDEVARRTRIEAAIGLATRIDAEPGEPGEGGLRARAAARLLADLGGAAWDLRVRMIDALGATGDADALRTLAAIALDADEPAEDRKRALEALAKAGDLAPVRRAAEAGRDAEVRIVALGRLAAHGEDLEPILAGLPDERIDDSERERLRLFVLRVGAERGSLTAAREAELLAGPWAEARATQAARFTPPRPGVARIPEPAFAWRGELDALEALAAHGRLGRLIDADALARLDGRFLFALGERAPAAGAVDVDGDVAFAVWRAAAIAFPSDVDLPDAKARSLACRLFGLAWSVERYGEAARLAERLAADHRARRGADAAWESAFGTRDVANGVDPLARVEAAAAQARAYAALERGAHDEAREHAREAATRVGASARAAREQERLELALERAEDDRGATTER